MRFNEHGIALDTSRAFVAASTHVPLAFAVPTTRAVGLRRARTLPLVLPSSQMTDFMSSEEPTLELLGPCQISVTESRREGRCCVKRLNIAVPNSTAILYDVREYDMYAYKRAGGALDREAKRQHCLFFFKTLFLSSRPPAKNDTPSTAPATSTMSRLDGITRGENRNCARYSCKSLGSALAILKNRAGADSVSPTRFSKPFATAPIIAAAIAGQSSKNCRKHRKAAFVSGLTPLTNMSRNAYEEVS